MDITLSLFPKFYKHLDIGGLAKLVREAGLDTSDMMIRDGYWVTVDSMAKDIPAFVNAMRGEGLEIKTASTNYYPSELVADSRPLALMSENGIKEFRMNYFKETENPAGAFAGARADLERLVPFCHKYGIRAIYQVHHRTLIASSWAAWNLVRGLPEDAVGVWIDPGNQSFEGYESWKKTALLLDKYVRIVGVKDTGVYREEGKGGEPGKGWSRSCVPIYEGVTNWYDLVDAVKRINFNGTFMLMPFYDMDNSVRMTEKLKKEVEYIGNVIKSVSGS